MITQSTTDKLTPISAVDLFCGAGGLTHGLQQAGIRVEAGIDIERQVQYIYEKNNPGSKFYNWNLAQRDSSDIDKLFKVGQYKLLAGCAPCQPFSKLTVKEKKCHSNWDLIKHFGILVKDILPEFVTMENVPELATRGQSVFSQFISTLKDNKYHLDWKIVNCRDYGIPQSRRRLVLLASRLGEIFVPGGTYQHSDQWKTVRTTIERLPPLEAGEADPSDPMHRAPKLSLLNLKRMRATKHNGGTRRDWPIELILNCHKKISGHSYGCNYGRMWWDKPAPTMTTHCTGIGNGRFGHPEQDRTITLREAALFQSFPKNYEFFPDEMELSRGAVERMIGNAIPPLLAEVLASEIITQSNDNPIKH